MDVARLIVTGPDGADGNEISLVETQLTVGRAVPGSDPDLALDDPELLISRLHCVIELDQGSWWVADNASRNGTYVRRDGKLTKVEGRRRLDHGDAVCILAAASDGDQRFHELRLVDPHSTAAVGAAVTADEVALPVDRPVLRWNADELRAEVVTEAGAELVELRKQAYLLIDHAAQRNAVNGGSPVVCSTDELMEAVWGMPEEWDKYRPPTVDNLRDLISDIRKVIEPNPKKPQILENVRGLGYRIHTA